MSDPRQEPRPAAPPATARRGRSAGIALAVALIVAVALGLRVWGSLIGLPGELLPDEAAKIEVAQTLAQRGYRHPGSHPGFLYNSLFLVLRAAGPLRTRFAAAPLPAGHGLARPHGSAFDLWAARLWLDSLSAATVLLVFCLTRALWGAGAGLAAAALLAVDPLAIAAANYVKEDTPLAFWTTASALACIALLRRGGVRLALAAGATAGLAFGSKFSGAFAALPVAIACLLAPAPRRRSRAPEDPLCDASDSASSVRIIEPKQLAWRGAAAAVGFLAGALLSTPAFVLEAGTLFSGMRTQLGYAAAGHHDGISLPLSDTLGLFYLRRAFLPAIGPGGLLAAAAGAWLLGRRESGAAIVMLCFAFGFAAMMEAIPTKPYPFAARYVLPALPALCSLAGVGCAELARLASRGRIGVRVAALAALGWVILVPAWRAGAFVAGMYPDTREEAPRWLADNLPAGAWLLTTTYGASSIPPGLRGAAIMDRPSIEALAAKARTPIFVLLSGFAVDRFWENPDDNPQATALFRWIVASSTHVHDFASSAPQYGFHQPRLELRRWNDVPRSGEAAAR